MNEKPKFSRRTLLTGAAVLVSGAGIAFAAGNTLNREPNIAMWWSGLDQNGGATRATLNVRIPAGVPSATDAQIFIDAQSFPVYAMKSITVNTPWTPFFAKDAPFQLLRAPGSADERTALVVVDFTRMSADEASGTVRASCTGGDGSLLAMASLNLAQPLVRGFS